MVRHISCRALQCYRAEVAAFGNFEKEPGFMQAAEVDSGGRHPTYRRHSRWLKPEFRPTLLCIPLVSAVWVC